METTEKLQLNTVGRSADRRDFDPSGYICQMAPASISQGMLWERRKSVYRIQKTRRYSSTRSRLHTKGLNNKCQYICSHQRESMSEISQDPSLDKNYRELLYDCCERLR